MKKFEEEFDYLIELSGKVLTGQIEAEKFEKQRAIFLNEYGKKQQPEIPEVPQFVADWLDKKPLYTINSFIPVEIIEWSKKQTGYADLGMNINHLLKLKVNGYTVETPKAIVTPCPVCGYEEVESNFCSICGRKNDYE